MVIHQRSKLGKPPGDLLPRYLKFLELLTFPKRMHGFIILLV
jgi:hypothetical protein